jgi:hypothetical protein
MPQENEDRNRWCATFASILTEEAGVPTSDALFLAQQVRVCNPGLPPTYAVRLALTNPQIRLNRVVAGRRWRGPLPVHNLDIEDVVGW